MGAGVANAAYCITGCTGGDGDPLQSGCLQAKQSGASLSLAAPHSEQKSRLEEIIWAASFFRHTLFSLYEYVDNAVFISYEFAASMPGLRMHSSYLNGGD